jgi:hypothetical protein
MAYKVIILYRLYMPSYFLGTFAEYPYKNSGAEENVRSSSAPELFLILFTQYHTEVSPSIYCSRNIFSPSKTAYENSVIQSPRIIIRDVRLSIKSSIM